MIISVIIPVFNGEAFIERALKSVFSQGFSKEMLEVIVINDGSTDQTKNILANKVNDLVVIHQKNLGLVASCNKGVKKAKGDYIIRLDADDYFAPELLSQTVCILEKNSEFDCAYTDRFEIDEIAGRTREFKVGKDNIFDMVACGTLIRRSVFEKIGYYDNLLFEEYDFYIRLFKRFKGFYITKPMYYYIKHGLNMTERVNYWEKGLKELIKKWGEEEIGKLIEAQIRERGKSRFFAMI